MSRLFCKSEKCTVKTKYPNGFCSKHGGGYFCTYESCNQLCNKHLLLLCNNHCTCNKCTKVSKVSTLSKPPKPPTIRNKCSIPNCTNTTVSPTGKCTHHNKYCPNCIEWIDARYGNKKYDGYCSTCFKHCFPNDSRASKIRSSRYDSQVTDFINQNFQGFVHDKPIYTHNCDCSNRRRIDHYLLLGNTVLAIETDEQQHRYYTDEEIRYNDLYMHFSGKWIFIRFNVHSFQDNKGRFRQTKFPNRLIRLKDEIQAAINRIQNDSNTEPLEIIKLFYNDFTFPRYQSTYDGQTYVKTLIPDD
jgi:hypothetical protein